MLAVVITGLTRAVVNPLYINAFGDRRQRRQLPTGYDVCAIPSVPPRASVPTTSVREGVRRVPVIAIATSIGFAQLASITK
jgi:hypothetical protein